MVIISGTAESFGSYFPECNFKILILSLGRFPCKKTRKDASSNHVSVRYIFNMTSLVVKWSGCVTTNHEVAGSIPGSTMGIFPCRERYPW